MKAIVATDQAAGMAGGEVGAAARAAGGDKTMLLFRFMRPDLQEMS